MHGSTLPLMAWRNLWRNRRRTLITLSSIVFGVFVAVMFTAMQDRNWADMIDLAARLGGGHVTIQHPGYHDAPNLKRTVQGITQLTTTAMQEQNVVNVVPRISGQIMLSTAGESYGGMFIAFDPAQENEDTLSLLSSNTLVAGDMFKKNSGKGIILGQKLAENLDAQLGDKIIYTLTDKSGEIVSSLSRLTGVIKTGAPGLDSGLALLPLQSVRKVINYAPDEATQLAVFIDDQRYSDTVAAALTQTIDDEAAVLPWHVSQPELAAMITLDFATAHIMEGIIALLVAAGIFNSLFVSVMERLREFGILLAIGFTPLRLFGLIMFESLWLALVGLIGAALFSIGPYLYLQSTGLDVSAMLGEEASIDVAGIAMPTTLKVGIFPESVMFIGIIALIAILLAGVYPAWRASSVEPVESIKLV